MSPEQSFCRGKYAARSKRSHRLYVSRILILVEPFADDLALEFISSPLRFCFRLV